MRKIITYLFFSSLFLVCITLSGQNKVFYLNLEGKRFEKLKMTSSRPYMSIKGESDNGFNWVFRIPEELYETVTGFEISYQDFDKEKNENFPLSFVAIEGSDTLKSIYNNFTSDSMVLNARFIESTKIVFPFAPPPLTSFSECFLVDFQPNTDLGLRQKYPLFSFFQEMDNTEREYEYFVEQYYDICRSNPTSRYLLTNIFRTRDYYNDRRDIQRLYDCFTDELKQSYYGKKIHEYITFYDFENVELLRSDNENYNYIIENPEKQTLLVFSASWCAACHTLLPTLRELYTDLRESLDMVYISCDEQSTVAGWQSFIEKEDIPWRSFLSYNNKEFRDRYGVGAIPYALLVTLDGKAKVINLRNEEERNELYSSSIKN